MGTTEKFCLRWNDFETNISSAFREIREEKDFFDVTLVCDDSQVQAHKVILSACSPFFRNVLRRNPHQHPLLYLKGVKYNELLSVLNFMYLGEVNVAQEELNSFLSVAEDLRVKGLTQGTGAARPTDQTKPGIAFKETPPVTKSLPPPIKRPRPPPPVSQNSTGVDHQPFNINTLADDDIQEVVPVKTEPRELSAPPPTQQNQAQVHHQYPENNDLEGTVALESYDDENYEYGQYEESYDVQMDSSMGLEVHSGGNEGNKDPIAAREEAIMANILRDNERKLFTCALCEFGASSRHKAFCHIEAKHFQDSPVTYSCQFCGKFVSSRNALGIHITRNHKEERQNAKHLNYS